MRVMGFYVFFRISSLLIPLVNLTDLCKKFGTRWHTCAKTCAKSTIFQICMYKTKLTETTWIAFITFTSSCCFRLSPCYWLVFELAVLISRCNIFTYNLWYYVYCLISVCYGVCIALCKIFGGQTGECIFAKKPIKSAKTHFF